MNKEKEKTMWVGITAIFFIIATVYTWNIGIFIENPLLIVIVCCVPSALVLRAVLDVIVNYGKVKSRVD
jgi:uncharacterized membrane protein